MQFSGVTKKIFENKFLKKSHFVQQETTARSNVCKKFFRNIFQE